MRHGRDFWRAEKIHCLTILCMKRKMQSVFLTTVDEYSWKDSPTMYSPSVLIYFNHKIDGKNKKDMKEK